MIAVWAEDAAGDGPAAARQELLAAHLAHVETILTAIMVAGPLLDGTGAVCGSLLVLDVADIAAAQALMDRDPYRHAGIWARINYRVFNGVAGRWAGGKIW